MILVMTVMVLMLKKMTMAMVLMLKNKMMTMVVWKMQ